MTGRARRCAALFVGLPFVALSGVAAAAESVSSPAPAASSPASGPAAPAAPLSPYDQAVQDRLSGRMQKAAAEFRALSKTSPQDADIWLNLGLALTATGDFDGAEAALKQGLALAPNYADLHIAYARLAYFRRRNAEARERLAPALNGTPSPDAQELLKDISASERDALGEALRVDATTSYASLSKGLAPWWETDLALARKIDPNTTLSGGLEQTSRFGEANTYLHAELGERLGDFGGFVGVGGSPDATYRAQEFVDGGLAAPAAHLGDRWTLTGEMDAAYGNYPTDSVVSLTPILTLARGDNLSLQARYLWTQDRFGKAISGYAIQAMVPVFAAVQLYGGYANAPDTSTGVTLKTHTYDAGIAWDLPARLVLRLSGAYETSRAYSLHMVTVGLTKRF